MITILNQILNTAPQSIADRVLRSDSEEEFAEVNYKLYELLKLIGSGSPLPKDIEEVWVEFEKQHPKNALQLFHIRVSHFYSWEYTRLGITSFITPNKKYNTTRKTLSDLGIDSCTSDNDIRNLHVLSKLYPKHKDEVLLFVSLACFATRRYEMVSDPMLHNMFWVSTNTLSILLQRGTAPPYGYFDETDLAYIALEVIKSTSRSLKGQKDVKLFIRGYNKLLKVLY